MQVLFQMVNDDIDDIGTPSGDTHHQTEFPREPSGHA